MDAVVNAVMARLVAAGHAAVGCIDDSSTFQRGNVSTPEIDFLLNGGQFGQAGNLLCCQFLLEIIVLYLQKSLTDGSRLTNIH